MPDMPVSGLPLLVVRAVANLVADRLRDAAPGHCVRVDNVRAGDGSPLVAALRSTLPSDGADVHVLVENRAAADGLISVPAERAVELRNRKERLLVLLVPVGTGSAASSLDNSFERLDIAELLRSVGETLIRSIEDEDLRAGVSRIGRELGRSRPVEAWARYVAAVVEEPTWDTVGRTLWMVGLVPDLGGAELLDRLTRNVRCVRAISRPRRAVAPVADRLDTAGLQEGSDRDRLARYLSRPDVDLSDPSAWTASLVGSADAPTFERWPLVERPTIDVERVTVVPFLKEDGSLRTGTQLRQRVPGGPPYAEAGPDRPATVKVTWKTEPSRTDGIARWLLEVLPPVDLREVDTEPLAKQSVKGDKRQATVRIELEEEDLASGALLTVRVTALDSAGQIVLLTDGTTEARDDSQEFAVHWEAEPIASASRRASTPSLALARLDAALDGQDDLQADSPSWDEAETTFSVRLGGRRTALLALSPALVKLQRRLLHEPACGIAWEANGLLGEALTIDGITAVPGADLPPALGERRRRLFSTLADRSPRDVVETLEWTAELRDEVAAYVQSFRRAVDVAADQQSRLALLTLDTLQLSVDTAGHRPIAAVLTLPLHPMRLAWFSGYDETLGQWAGQLAELGRSKAVRGKSVDRALVRRVTPANLPFAVLGADALPYVYTREATLGTGIYLDPAEQEPGAAVHAVFDVLGLGRRDVSTGLSPSVLAERLEAYRRVHPGHEALRLLTYNPGSGELLADALTASVLQHAGDDGEPEPAPGRVEISAYCRRRSLTDPLPALTDLQGRLAGRQVEGAPTYLAPPLGIAVRSAEGLAGETDAANLGVVVDLARVTPAGRLDAPETSTSFRNLLSPTANERVADGGVLAWRTSPSLRTRGRGGAADAVDAHRSYSRALSTVLGLGENGLALSATLGPEERAALRAAHERADWVMTLDRHLGVDLFAAPPDDDRPATPYILDYAPDFLEGLGPRLTVTTAHPNEVHRLLADAMTELNLAAVDESVRDILGHLQVVSGRLALRLVGRSTLATEAVSLAALIAHLRGRGDLKDTVVVPVDAHQDVFGDAGGEAGVRRCDVVFVRATARTLRLECVEVKSRRAAVLPTVLADEIVDQLESTVAMLRDTFFRLDPPRIDGDLQRARLVGILRHHANRAQAMELLDVGRRADMERLLERLEEGSLVPEISMTGYVVNLTGQGGLPREHRGVRIHVLTAAELGRVGLTSLRAEPDVAASAPARTEPEARSSGPDPVPDPAPRPSPQPRPRSDGAPTAVPPEPPPASPPTGSTPPSPPAHRPPPREVVDVRLGQDAHAAEVRWRISTKGSPHMFVLGIPGQGKSVTTRHVLSSFAEQGLPALVLDFHGDMAAEPARGSAVLDATAGLDFSPFELRDDAHYRFSEAAWELAEVIGYVCDLGEIQQNLVYEAVRDLYRQHGFGTDAGPDGLPAMTELADLVAELERRDRVRNVAARLRPLTDFGLFVQPRDERGFGELLRTGVVIDVHGVMEQVQVAAGAFVLRKVYREMFRWGQSGELRLAVVLDEAHRLARDVTLPKIMKEGRKYGVAVLVASQGVDDFHRDVLGNAGTKVAFRCNFPQSRKVAGFLRGRAGQDMSTALEKLSVGQAYVSTPEHAEARRVFMAHD